MATLLGAVSNQLIVLLFITAVTFATVSTLYDSTRPSTNFTPVACYTTHAYPPAHLIGAIFQLFRLAHQARDFLLLHKNPDMK